MGRGAISFELCDAINTVSSLERSRTITALSKMNAQFTFDLPNLNIVWSEPEPAARGGAKDLILPMNPKFLSTFKSVAAAVATTTTDINTVTNSQDAPPQKAKKSLVFKYQLTPGEQIASAAADTARTKKKPSHADVESEARRVLFGDDDEV